MVYRQKELLLYVVDDNNYFSSLNNKYFQFHYNVENIILEKKIVMFGFDTFMKTDRIFIIPRFKCSYKKKFINYFCRYILSLL